MKTPWRRRANLSPMVFENRREMPGIQGPKLVANIGSGRKTFA
jgi:hypothetical protein